MDQDDTNTSYSTSDPLAETRSIIDRDIARLEENIRALKSRRNELAPISRLPVEILCNIFSLVEDNSIFHLNQSPELWTSFSRVSQHWRSSALGAPALWTNIPLSYPRWAQEMLIRSKKAKLTIRSGVYLDGSNPRIIETVKSCLYEMNRVGEIKLTSIPGLILEEIFRDLPKSAPQLHTLFLDSSLYYPGIHFPGTAFSIHEDLLCDTEQLQRVGLIKCKISWDSQFLTGLTSLALEDSLYAGATIFEVLHALKRMPTLVDLYLKDSIPDDLQGQSTYPVVDLPCLRVLNISSGVDPLTAVLRQLNFPQSAILNLVCKESQSTQIDFSKFLSVLATRFLPSLVFRSLSLRASDDNQMHGLEFFLWTTENGQDCFPIHLFCQFQLHLVLTWPSQQPHNHEKVLLWAFNAIGFPFLTQLQIVSTSNCIDCPTSIKTFGRLPRLEKVCVQSYAPYPFLEAMVYKTSTAEKSIAAYRKIPFPKLRYIHLIGSGFKFFSRTLMTISVDILMDYLMERCERNAEIQVLRLDGCYCISSYDVKKLKEIVVDVVWDGIEQEVLEEGADEGSEYDIDYDDSDGNDFIELGYDPNVWY